LGSNARNFLASSIVLNSAKTEPCQQSDIRKYGSANDQAALTRKKNNKAQHTLKTPLVLLPRSSSCRRNLTALTAPNCLNHSSTCSWLLFSVSPSPNPFCGRAVRKQSQTRVVG
jgi:hypothetical protein